MSAGRRMTSNHFSLIKSSPWLLSLLYGHNCILTYSSACFLVCSFSDLVEIHHRVVLCLLQHLRSQGGALFHVDPCPPTLLRANRCQLFSSRSSGHKEAASLPMKQFQLLKRRPPRLASPPSSFSPTAAYKASSVSIFFVWVKTNHCKSQHSLPSPSRLRNTIKVIKYYRVGN